MKSWDEIRTWRRETRAKLLNRRLAVRLAERERVGGIVTRLLREAVPELWTGCVGFCWQFKGEIDFRHSIGDAMADGAAAALPVVVERARPLEFWAWHPRMKLKRGIWGIPIPTERQIVQPTALLVPLLGFDPAGYRLGYGGGYYDRTLAVTAPKPLTIGVGYALGRLETIYPQPHDIPMDAIVTEEGYAWISDPARLRHGSQRTEQEGQRSAQRFAPPACVPKSSPSSPAYMNRAELLALLGELLESERAGARGVSMMSRQAAGSTLRAALHDIAKDEAGFCAMLTRHITRLGGRPSSATGAFYDKLLASEDSDHRLGLLNRGQGWVVRKLREAIPRIDDDALHRDLKSMLAIHERNIEACTALTGLQHVSGYGGVGDQISKLHDSEPAAAGRDLSSMSRSAR